MNDPKAQPVCALSSNERYSALSVPRADRTHWATLARKRHRW
ncbi:hypothetical protein ANCDUO_02470 [Ancylostoma duodenale]|uniref:Uncharacterized protein n=1 Tax=Ancylostoma duodenale TaxID=51022 RepID=A0A0C2DBM3_9BILA|nr:hypothetical protein ANCDUO_02470 [Ancylostoma duodenale]